MTQLGHLELPLALIKQWAGSVKGMESLLRQHNPLNGGDDKTGRRNEE